MAQQQIYPAAIDLLVCAISVNHSLNLDIVGTAVVERSRNWEQELSVVMKWLDEELFASNLNSAPIQTRLLEESCTSIHDKWTDVIEATAQDAHISISSIDELTWVYLIFCRSLANTLLEFDHLIQEFYIHSDDFYQRYVPNRPQLQALVDALRNEQLETDKQLNETNKSLLSLIEMAAQSAASNWNQTVMQIASA